jgi:NMD protein affecting ribosome stability and mRNA decay
MGPVEIICEGCGSQITAVDARLCDSCIEEREAEAEGERWADERESAPCYWWGGR